MSQERSTPLYESAVREEVVEETDAQVVNTSDEEADGCHDSYSGACVPVDNGEVDCGDLSDESFDVVGYDEFGLDADIDGIACEPYNPIDEDDDGCHDSYSGECVPVDEGEPHAAPKHDELGST